jgi:hypothetical protein
MPIPATTSKTPTVELDREDGAPASEPSRVSAGDERPNTPAPMIGHNGGPPLEPPTGPPDDLWERKTVEAYFGGNRPLHTSTLYRGIRDGIYPKPIRVSRSAVRWLASECRAAAQRMIAARDDPPKRAERRRRPRRLSVGGDNAAA